VEQVVAEIRLPHLHHKATTVALAQLEVRLIVLAAVAVVRLLLVLMVMFLRFGEQGAQVVRELQAALAGLA
jgi:hypothetical protein